MASEIRVNKIENRSGLGTVTFADTGVDLAGIVTATTFSGSGASLTNIPSAQLTGALPAISGANLTGIAATDNVRTGILDVAGVGTFRNDVNISDKIIHLGDTNTAIRFPSADTITAETGGSERLRITSDGKIGINDSTPSVTLETVGHNQVTFGSMPETIISYGTASAYDSGSAGSGIQFGGYYNSTPEYTIFAGVHGVKANTTNSNYAGNLVFSTRTNGGNSAERMRLDSTGNLKFNSGYGSVGTAYGVRAWLKMYWDSGTPTISGSGNVSSLTDTATGDFAINLTTALPDAVYATCVSGDEYGQSQAPSFNTGFTSRGYTTSAITVNATNHSGTSTDIKSVQVIVVR